MPRTVYESVTVLEPRDDLNYYDMIGEIKKDLFASHPDWKGMHLTVRINQVIGKQPELRIVVVDPNAPDPSSMIFWVIVVAVCLLFAGLAFIL